MIEKSLMTYLLNNTALNTALGGKIYYRRAPTTAKMPWLVITNSGGMRLRRTMGGTNDTGWSKVKDTLTLYVDHTDQFKGKDITDMVVAAVENYRGDMGTEKDLFIRCESPRDLDGYQGTFRYHIPLHVDYWFKTTFATPEPVV